MRRRRLALGCLLVGALLALAPPAAAHPLGNATVNRAVAVLIAPTEVQVTYVVDMAEIPAYAAALEIDGDRDTSASGAEQEMWSAESCNAAAAAVDVSVDDEPPVLQRAGVPVLTFPPGVGGLETLRLVCHFTAALPAAPGPHRIAVSDQTEDGRRGWREVTIAAADGIALVTSDVPSVSPSRLLTAYPNDLLAAPVDTRSGAATYRATRSAVVTGAAGVDAAGPATTGGSAAKEDPFAALLTAPRTPLAWLVAVVLAMGLGAAHALSPGHGKALIAAYVIGSRSAVGQAVGLGLSAAASHTIGVLLLGAIVLSASELLVPERVVAWLSVGSGILVVIVGGLVAARALRRRRAGAGSDHGHAHAAAHEHGPGGHRHGRDEQAHVHAGRRSPFHEVVALGLVGGAIPSTSALLVLLVAVATGRLVEGMLLIVAFGLGMAIVLGGFAAVTGLAGSRLTAATERSGVSAARRLSGAAPLVSAGVIMAVGAVTTIGALGSL